MHNLYPRYHTQQEDKQYIIDTRPRKRLTELMAETANKTYTQG